MADIFTKEKRSEIMSRIRGHGNLDTEIATIKIFREFKIVGWRRKLSLFGKPDFVFPQKRIAIFVDGCFWHGCPKHQKSPKSNRYFWKKKLFTNKERDNLVNLVLRKKGWRVLRIWEHELKNKFKISKKIKKLLETS
jgi:DNA mismatch endonuclease, patch repair protein